MEKLKPDVWIEAKDSGEVTSAAAIQSVMPAGEKLQQISKKNFATMRNTPDEYIYRGYEERKIGKVLYNLWDENVEIPNETDNVQYNKGYMHALADVKKHILGGDNFPGELENLSLSKRNEQGDTE